jgi:gliding motility-associated-like protein
MLFKWDLADGTIDTAYEDTFSYQYKNAGVYYPSLTLIDSTNTCEAVIKNNDSIVVYDLPMPNFEAVDSFVCVNTDVQLLNKTPQQNQITNWLWKIDDINYTNQSGPITLRFNKPGTHKVGLIATSTLGCIDSLIKPTYIVVSDDTIPPSIPLTFSATVVNNQSTAFSFGKSSTADFNKYKVYYSENNNPLQNHAIVYDVNDTLFIQSTVQPLNTVYSYAVSAIDACNNESNTSKAHTTINLRANGVANGIILNWNAYQGFDSVLTYEIWRNNSDSGNQFYLINQTNQPVYIDSMVSCNTTYYYKVKAISFYHYNRISWSDSSGAKPIYLNTLPATEIYNATVVGNKSISVYWKKIKQRNPFTYVILRSKNNELNYAVYKETSDTFYNDLAVDVSSHSYQYKVVLKDACQGFGPESNVAKTILLLANLQKVNEGLFYPVVYFNNYTKWTNGAKQTNLFLLDELTQNFELLNTLTPADTFYLHAPTNSTQRAFCYQVTAIESGGNQQKSESNMACVEITPVLHIPNVFSVNQDGLNDVFYAKGLFIESFKLTIVDRWGNIAFILNSLKEGWDGTIGGSPAPAGVYAYIAEAKDITGKQIIKEGTITLLR